MRRAIPARPERAGSRTILAVGVVCAAAAIGSAAAPSPTVHTEPSAEEIIAARQASMAMSAALLGTIKIALERGAAADTQGYQVGGLSRWAKALPGMFPTGTGPESTSLATRARAEVWSQRATFERNAEDLIAATAKLRELAQDKDTQGLKNQIVVVHDACESCHQTFMKK